MALKETQNQSVPLRLPTLSDPELAAKIKEKFGWEYPVEEAEDYLTDSTSLHILTNDDVEQK